MFSALQLKERMNAQPFKPIRICLSDGRTYDITKHDMAFVKRNAIQIGIDTDPNGLAECFSECAILHITQLEDLEPARNPPNPN